MEREKNKILASEMFKESKPITLHEQAKEYLFFQIYIASEFIHDKYGLDALKDFYVFNQEGFFRLKMSAIYKAMEVLIKKLPKSLKIKEGLKMAIKELQFLESLKNIEILENTKDSAIFEVSKCSLRKEFNKLAKKSNKPELVDKCCLWCIESTKFSENYGLCYKIELTDKGCLNYLS